MSLVYDLLPESTDEQRYEGLLEGLRQANAFGITAYIEPGVSEDNFSVFATAARRGASVLAPGVMPRRSGRHAGI